MELEVVEIRLVPPPAKKYTMVGVRVSLPADGSRVTSVRSKPSFDARRQPVHVTTFASSVSILVRSLTLPACADNPAARERAMAAVASRSVETSWTLSLQWSSERAQRVSHESGAGQRAPRASV